ncbi:MAG: hypothetical protein O3C21_14070, partial [Verrucomicrobia bacterium]|nr:hypothetical protein [Verrucomicrobiota bacterium]
MRTQIAALKGFDKRKASALETLILSSPEFQEHQHPRQLRVVFQNDEFKWVSEQYDEPDKDLHDYGALRDLQRLPYIIEPLGI